MTKWFKGKAHNMALHITISVVVLIVMFGVIAGIIGYTGIQNSLTAEYSKSALRTARTAADFLDVEQFEKYLQDNGTDSEYHKIYKILDTLCASQNVTFIYVIIPDTSDFNSFTSVFNVVNPDSVYTPWEVGYVRETTNEEYRRIYEELYNKEFEYTTLARVSNLNGREPHITLLTSLKDSEGNVGGILCVERPMDELRSSIHRYLFWILIAVITLAIVSILTWSTYLRKLVINPIRQITDEAVRFAAQNTEDETGQLTDITSFGEINTLAGTIAKMEKDTVRYMDHLTKVTAEKERIGAELNLATKIQADMLPRVFPPFPDHKEFDLYATMDPAKEVGGDFYDFFLIDETHLALVIADVSGKGVPAALFMVIAKTLIKNRALMGGTPSLILSYVNEQLCEGNVEEFFVTVWMAIVDLTTGKGVAANAGHEHPAIRHAGGKWELSVYPHSLAVAAMEGVCFWEHEFELYPGDTLYVYTDGVPEAVNENNEMFGTDRMLKALQNCSGNSPREYCEEVKKELDAFVGTADQFDDITMLTFNYYGPEK